MPKLSGLVSLSTVRGVASGIIAGSVATVSVQHYVDSSEFSKDPQRAEMREEQKKVSFEIQQQSEALEKEKQNLETQKQSLARGWEALREKEAVVQQMQQTATATQGAAAEVVAVETVQQVAQAAEPADEQPEKPKADVVPADHTPKRPAVFDGGGSKEKPVETTNKNNTSEPSVAFGSSGDVVTVEKDGNSSDAEAERLREEVETLRRRLAEKDDASKEKALREWEERLRERERALSEMLRKRNVESKATQTDDPLFEAATGGNDPFDKPGSKKDPGMRGADADQLKESREVEVFISGSPKKPDTDGIRNKITNTAIPNVDTKKTFEAMPTYERKTNAKNIRDIISAMSRKSEETKGATGITTNTGIVTSSGGGIPPPPPPPPPPGVPLLEVSPLRVPPIGGAPKPSAKTFMQKFEKNFRPAFEELEIELKEKEEKERESAKEADFLKSLTEKHPIAMAYKCIQDLDNDDKEREKNEEKKKRGEPEASVLDRDKFKQNTCIALERCAKDLKELYSDYGCKDCMMRLLRMFVSWNGVNEKTVLETFQEKLSSFWLDAFAYFVTTPEDKLKKAYETYKRYMTPYIKQTSDNLYYYCSRCPTGTLDTYNSYDECRDKCVDFVVLDKTNNRSSLIPCTPDCYISMCPDAMMLQHAKKPIW
ncbi:MAG: hypothetical protein IJ793_02785 [Opitutales bacterium]|nr:hypothetical protein [Opitutales bacterium]